MAKPRLGQMYSAAKNNTIRRNMFYRFVRSRFNLPESLLLIHLNSSLLPIFFRNSEFSSTRTKGLPFFSRKSPSIFIPFTRGSRKRVASIPIRRWLGWACLCFSNVLLGQSPWFLLLSTSDPALIRFRKYDPVIRIIRDKVMSSPIETIFPCLLSEFVLKILCRCWWFLWLSNTINTWEWGTEGAKQPQRVWPRSG